MANDPMAHLEASNATSTRKWDLKDIQTRDDLTVKER